MATKLNGSAKWITLVVTIILLIVTFTASYTMKANKSEVTAVCSRVTVVEKDIEYQGKTMDEVKVMVGEVHDLQLEILRKLGEN